MFDNIIVGVDGREGGQDAIARDQTGGTMFDNVLIAIDGRQGGRDAIALAKQLAGPNASYSLAHVYGTAVYTRGATGKHPVEHEASIRLLAAERTAANMEANLVSTGFVSPARGLHELAEHGGADLLVVGSSRHALLGRVLLGDDARASLDGAPCAVAIAPRGYADSPDRLLEIGVGYDGSPESERALIAARELARSHGARIRALSVVSLKNVRDEKPIPADWPETAERLVDERLNRLSELDGIEGEAVYGGPREELSRFSGEVDVLIVGSRGYGPLGRILHGSVSRYLVRHAACPLLVLARGAVGDPAAESADHRPESRSRRSSGLDQAVVDR
ncbi:MAG TPA: universal stress protein, partial [Solirubrobacteraceae bacterium]|nr:universal stress protein [Solirubrobacteraceae bacterium]